MFFRQFLHGGSEGPENLDRPISNFDVIGIPTGGWSSGFFSCHHNIVPSCLMSFFCPCFQWSQIVVRAQIPLLIGLKNSFPCTRQRSGFGPLVEYYFWSLVLSLGLILLLIFVDFPSQIIVVLLAVIVFAVLFTFAYLVGHSRTAFKEKYEIPSFLPPGCYFWDMVLDAGTMFLCFPCALSQMARHVFQYDRMDTPLGMYFGDPSALPPLRPLDEEAAQGDLFQRPARADNAGLHWTTDARHPLVRDQRGAAHRGQEVLSRQVSSLQPHASAPSATSSLPVANAAPVTNTTPMYRADGSAV